MPFSFVRAFAASRRFNISTIKKEAKRLQKASAEVFGQVYSLNICQEAIARAHGLRNWQDIINFEKRIGRDKSLPFWHIDSRNDFHERLLKSLLLAEVETNETFIGKREHAIAPALCLWSEEISYARVPGVILVDTKAQSVQDTMLWEQVKNLNLDDLFLQFRSIDTRVGCLPVSIRTQALDWTRSLGCALPEDICKHLEDTGIWHVMRESMKCDARTEGDDSELRTVYFDAVEKAFRLVSATKPYVPVALGDVEGPYLDSLRHSVDKYLVHRPMEAIEVLGKLIRSLAEKQFNLRTVFWIESAQRPTIVVFDSDKPETVALASVIHSLYYSRYVGCHLRHAGIITRPVLYFGDQSGKPLPQFLRDPFAARTILVAGYDMVQVDALSSYEKRTTTLVHTDEFSLVADGKRVSIKEAA